MSCLCSFWNPDPDCACQKIKPYSPQSLEEFADHAVIEVKSTPEEDRLRQVAAEIAYKAAYQLSQMVS